MCWIDPGIRTQLQARRGGIAVGVLFSMACLVALPFLLRTQALPLCDLLTGPQTEHGVVQDLDRWALRHSTPDGILVVDGVNYRAPDLDWFGELSVGQLVEFLHGPETGLAFAPHRGGFPRLALLLIVGSLAIELTALRLAHSFPSTDDPTPFPHATHSLLRTIQEHRDERDTERARQERES